MFEVMIKHRRPMRILLLPLEFAIRLSRKLVRLILNNAQISTVQELGVGFVCGTGLSVQNAGVMVIGDEFHGSDFLHLSSYSHGELKIGKRCFFGDNCKVIVDNSIIQIGDDCLIAEQVSIRASNHGTDAGHLMNKQPNVCKDIVIGNDVWIGKGAMVLAGSKISDGVVIGANSVVTPGTEIERYCIYAGNPIRKIRTR